MLGLPLGAHRQRVPFRGRARLRQLLLAAPTQVRLAEGVPDRAAAVAVVRTGRGGRGRVAGDDARVQAAPGERAARRHARGRLVRVQVGRGPSGEAGLTVVAVCGGAQHHWTTVRPVRSERAERSGLRAQPGPPSDVAVALAQYAAAAAAGAGACAGGTGGRDRSGRRRVARTILARVLLVPVGDVQPLQGGLHAQLMLAQVGARFV